MIEDAFLLKFQSHPDFSFDDELAEIKNYVCAQKAIQSFLNGKLKPNDLLNLLELAGYDPVQYAQEVEENVRETVLWLPSN